MNFDLREATNKVRQQLESALEDGTPGSVHKNAYQIALVALAGLPNREATVAYILGIVAGCDLHIHEKLPESPLFKHRTREALDYAEGIKDALMISTEFRRSMPTTGDLLAQIFGGK